MLGACPQRTSTHPGLRPSTPKWTDAPTWFSATCLSYDHDDILLMGLFSLALNIKVKAVRPFFTERSKWSNRELNLWLVLLEPNSDIGALEPNKHTVRALWLKRYIQATLRQQSTNPAQTKTSRRIPWTTSTPPSISYNNYSLPQIAYANIMTPTQRRTAPTPAQPAATSTSQTATSSMANDCQAFFGL